MVTDTKIKIVGYIKTNGQARVKDLTDHLGIGPTAIHRQLKKLVEDGKLTKSGSAPKVFYTLALKAVIEPTESNQLLDKYFVYVDPTGQLLTGMPGFKTWLTNVNKDNQFHSLLARYIKDRTEANAFYNTNLWIDATENIKKTFAGDTALDGVFYADFYSLPTFGKTRLGTLMLYAKQSENKELIAQISDETKNLIMTLIDNKNISAIGFLPHSILRKVQFLKEYAKCLNLPLSKIGLTKAYPGTIRVAQKTLGRLEERVRNARETIFVENINDRYENILLIDDAVGSASTLNETAKKLKGAGIAQKVYGFAVVGSYKGFEVIREV